MDLETLRAVDALARLGHFGRAAELLGISQPALTKRLRAFEKELGGPLFLRNRRHTTPTLAGRALLQRIPAILQEAERAEQATRAALIGAGGLLRIGTGFSVMLAGLPDAIRQFRRRRPGVRVAVKDMSSREQAAALRAGDLELGFLRKEEAATLDADWRKETIRHESLRLASATVRPPVLRDQPLVTISPAVSATYRQQVDQVCRALHYQPAVIEEVNQLIMVLMLVRAGVGVGLVPDSLRQLAFPGVHLAHSDLPEGAWQIQMVWRPEPLLDAFANVARQRLGAA